MRNLKKLLAVVLTVVMIASMMVPALAANTYEAEALKLQSIGMFAGEPADLKLEEGVTRIQGLAFAIRAAGVEADAFAMTDEEVATILDTYVDGADVPEWGRKYAAYAIKNGITVGVSATEKKFAALDPISGTSFLVFLMKAGMGYADVTTATVVEASVDAGILTAGQAATFGAKAALIRDDAAGILYGAAMNGVNADGTPLIEALIASGFVDRDAALEAGFVEEVVPEELEVVEVTATNLIQAVVTFNQPVDEDTAGDEDNYGFATSDKIKINDASLSEDATSVTLTFDKPVDQQKKAKLTISGIKSANGELMSKVTEEVYFLDNTFPEILSVEVIGVSTIKVTFSEPMDPASKDKSDFKVNDGKFYVQDVLPNEIGNEWKVMLYTSLKTGELPFEVKVGPTDYAGFTAMGLVTTLNVVEDKDAPVVVGYKNAKPTEVTLIWDEDIQFDGKNLPEYYHTNEKNKASEVKIDGKEMTLEFKTEDKLPNGIAYVYVKKEAIKDYWNNKNAQQMVKLEVTVDTDAPEVTKVEVKNEDEIQLTFNETLNKAEAEKRSNYTLLDSDGDKLNEFKASKPFTYGDKKVTVKFKEDLDKGDYTLVIDGVEDTAGNAMSKVAVDFTIIDKTEPTFPESANLYVVTVGSGDDERVAEQYIIVNFGDDMATDGQYSVLDIDKYQYAVSTGATDEELKNFADVTDAAVSLEANGQSVRIDIPHKQMLNIKSGDPAPVNFEDYVNITGDYIIKIARVADTSGNFTKALSSGEITLKATADKVEIEKIELINDKTAKVYFNAELSKFDADDLMFYNGGDENQAETASTELKDGKTVATYEFEDAFNTDASDMTVKVVATESETQYGEKLEEGPVAGGLIKDKAAPKISLYEFVVDEEEDNVTAAIFTLNEGELDEYYRAGILIQFTEELDYTTVSKLTFDVDGFDVEDAYVTGTDNDQILILLKLIDEEIVLPDKGTSISQVSAIADLLGNKVTDLETTVNDVIEP